MKRFLIALTFLLFFVPMLYVRVWAFTVSAGGNQSIALPVKDVTLFGQTSVAYSPTQILSVAWTKTSGPSGAAISAPDSLTTSVSVTQAGTYVFQISVYDGTSTATDSATITVSDATAYTSYYVDPSYTGGSNDGSAAHPWTTVSFGSVSNTPWNTINSSLASNPVIVYFSARQAGSDTVETQNGATHLWRTDTSVNALVLDGMSKYNTNDSAGSWTSYSGSNKFNLHDNTGDIAIGVAGTPAVFFNYTTVRGFKVTLGRVGVSGNHTTVEYTDLVSSAGNPNMFENTAVDGQTCTASGSAECVAAGNNVRTGTVAVTSGSPNIVGTSTDFLTGMNVGGVVKINGETKILLSVTDNTHAAATTNFGANASSQQYETCQVRYGNHTNITFRSNTITNGGGEGIYLGGNYIRIADGGCPVWGNSHTDVLVENNTIDYPGTTDVGEPDGVDIKAGYVRLTVRGNTISHTEVSDGNVGPGFCIISLGVPNVATNPMWHLYERNTCIHAQRGGEAINGNNQNGLIVRNNVNTDGGLEATGDGISVTNYNLQFYNNTDWGGGGMAVLSTNGAKLRNNIVGNMVGCTGSSGEILFRDGITVNLDSDYNDLQTGCGYSSGFSETHSISVSSGTTQFVNVSTNNFHLAAASPAIGAAIVLGSGFTGSQFLRDIAGSLRVASGVWDMGAYLYTSGSTASPGISVLRLR